MTRYCLYCAQPIICNVQNDWIDCDHCNVEYFIVNGYLDTFKVDLGEYSFRFHLYPDKYAYSNDALGVSPSALVVFKPKSKTFRERGKIIPLVNFDPMMPLNLLKNKIKTIVNFS